MERLGRVDILVNNAANNPKVEGSGRDFSRLENFPLDQWNADVAVGLTGPFLCAQVIGGALAKQRHGVVVNISSEYGVIAPDQRLYRREGMPDDQQPVKPVSYTVVKAGLHGLTLYLASYWAADGVRVNTITLGGVENAQPSEFLRRAVSRIPMGPMPRTTCRLRAFTCVPTPRPSSRGRTSSSTAERRFGKWPRNPSSTRFSLVSRRRRARTSGTHSIALRTDGRSC